MRRLVLALLLLTPTTAVAAPYTKVTAPYTKVTGPARANRTVIVLHGGAWYAVGREVTDATAERVRRFGRWGNRVVNADYAARAAGLEDVLAVYDAERRRAPEARICLYGESAGAHWALMVAALRRDVDCVISAAGPADLLFARATEPDGVIASAAAYAFGGQLLRYSPVAYASRIRAHLLLEFAATDAVVPPIQGALLARLAPKATSVVLGTGEVVWIHTTVDRVQLLALRQRERNLIGR